MNRPAATALCSAMPMPEGVVPDWIHLLPAGTITTQDGRGPYRVPSLPALAEQLNAGGKLALDECHSTDLAAPSGAPAPARGWMTEFEARDDGLWALVKWTAKGRAIMEDGDYNGISPVILCKKDNTVIGLLRASLTNAPNLRGLTALHSQEPHQEELVMSLNTKLCEMLGLDADTDEAAIMSALEKKLAAPAAHAQQFDVTKDPAFLSLQSELAEAVTKLNAQGETARRDKAEAFIDGAIAEGRVGVKAVRDKYIARHMADAAETEEFIAALPMLKGAALQSEIPQGEGNGELDAEDRRVMALMGLDEESYKASRDGAAQKKEAL